MKTTGPKYPKSIVLKAGDVCWLRSDTAREYRADMPDSTQPLTVVGKRPRMLIVRRADGHEFPIVRGHIAALNPVIVKAEREEAERKLEYERQCAAARVEYNREQRAKKRAATPCE